ncbi:MAG: fimbrial protein [Muribaculaceae bacterium]
MKRQKHIILFAILALFVASCSKETTIEPLPDGAVSITIALPKATIARETVDGVGAENHIKELKVFLFEPETGTLERVIEIDPKQSKITDKDSWDNATNTLVMRDFPQPSNPRTVYVIANWNITAADLAKIQNEAALIASFTELAGQVVTPTEDMPLLMSGNVKKHSFKENNSLKVKVKRQVVKIELTVSLDAKFTEAFPSYKFNSAKIEMCNAPKQSYVCEQATPTLPAGNTLFPYTEQEMTKAGNTWTTTIYAYENPALGIDDPSATYFNLQLPYTATNNTYQNYYKLSIKNSADAVNPNATIRNTIYRMKVNIIGFGAENLNNAEVTTDILPWDAEDLTSSNGDYITSYKDSITISLSKEVYLYAPASDYGKLKWVSKNNKVNAAFSHGATFAVFVKEEEAGLEFIKDFDVVTISCGTYSKTIKVSYEPCMAQRFAKGMLVSDGAGGVTIGAPNSDPKQNLLFKYGRPIGMLSHANGSPLTIAYNKTTLPSETNFKPVADGFNSAFSADSIDYLEHDLDADGWVGKDAGDVCRIMGKKDGYYWRIPTKREWIELLKEGTRAVSMDGKPLEGSGNPAVDFGWFCGPTASEGTKDNAHNPPKGSIFLYNLSYGQNGTPTTVHAGVLNIGSSSLFDPDTSVSSNEAMGYVTANGLYIGAESNVNVWLHSMAIRCIRDYSKK